MPFVGLARGLAAAKGVACVGTRLNGKWEWEMANGPTNPKRVDFFIVYRSSKKIKGLIILLELYSTAQFLLWRLRVSVDQLAHL